MAINIQVYGNANAATRTITMEFLGDIVAGSFTPLSTASDYFIRISTGATDVDSNRYEAKLEMGLDTLALNGVKRSAADSSVAYEDIRTMVIDYTYDYIYGHIEDQYGSGCIEQRPMAI